MRNLVGKDVRKDFIRKQPCFNGLSPSELNILVDLCDDEYVRAKTTIVKEGDLVDSVYIIIEGTAEVLKETIVDGELHYETITTLKSGDAIGLNETGFFSLSGYRTATVKAVSDMVLLSLSVPRFHGFALNYPHVNERMREYAERVLNIKDERTF